MKPYFFAVAFGLLAASVFTASVQLPPRSIAHSAGTLNEATMALIVGRDCPGCTTSDVMDCYGAPSCAGCGGCPTTDENWFNRTRQKCDTDPPENGAQCDAGQNNFPCYNLSYCTSGDDLPMQACQNDTCVDTNDDLDDCAVCSRGELVPNSTGYANNDTCVSCGS